MTSVASFASVAAVALGAACGGGSGTPPTTDGAKAGATETPAAHCLAVADAKRDRKPDEPDVISVSHILVEHKDAKSPKAGVVRTREEACLLAMEAQKKLAAGADFTKLVGEYSDSPGASSDGSIGSVHRSDLEPTFADAAFQLSRGQMSDVVETPRGFHVIVRTE